MQTLFCVIFLPWILRRLITLRYRKLHNRNVIITLPLRSLHRTYVLLSLIHRYVKITYLKLIDIAIGLQLLKNVWMSQLDEGGIQPQLMQGNATTFFHLNPHWKMHL